MSDTATAQYQDDQLVYVDPDDRVVVGLVEWNKNGDPKSKPYAVTQEEEGVGRKRWRKFYPWGTYKSMKRIYRLEGKQGKQQPDKTLDEVIPLALEQPFWN